MGVRQSYPRPKAEKLELVIRDVVYDVTDFVKKHPGGGIIYEQYAPSTFISRLNPDDAGFPADATAAYESLHGHSKKPDAYLKALKAAGKARSLTPSEIALIAKRRPFDAQLQASFDKATRELKEQGLFEYSPLHLLWRNVELFTFMFLGGWAAASGTTLGWWLSALCGGIFMQRAGWFQHECNHGSSSTNQSFNNLLGSFWFGFGEAGSAAWWKREHNRHHADPQRHGADIDMNTLPLALDSVTAKGGNKTFLSIQHYGYQAAIWGLVHFWQLYIHPRFIIKHRAVTDAAFLILHWVVFLSFCVPRLGWQSSLLLHAAASAVEASLLFTNFALSHTTMPFIENHEREHWVERSLRRTVDIHSHSKKFGSILGPLFDSGVDWLMGFLNYQVVHHLWPLMPHKNQSDPRVHAAVQRICDENPGLGLTYNVTTYDRAMWDMYANLARIAGDYGLGKDTTAVHPQKPDWVSGVELPKLKKLGKRINVAVAAE
ncbi:Acyl-CoA [Kappamyces sp. JEL0829]|nr:Acyl-CoA [Kappamyces sp. JEL0829]